MSSELIVKVQKIHKIIEHGNATALEVAVIGQDGGWETCVKKDIFHEGDLVIFVPPDALMPRPLADMLGIAKYLGELPASSTERAEGLLRVKAANLRGKKSFGTILTKEDVLNYLNIAMPIDQPALVDLSEGADVAELLGIKKWVPKEKYMDGDAAKPISLFHKYTDIQNYRNYPGVFKQGEIIVITEKIHGKNSRFGLVACVDGDIADSPIPEMPVLAWAAGSHGVQRKEFDSAGNRSDYWKPLSDNMKCMLAQLARENPGCFSVICFAEIYGAGVQNLTYGIKDTSYRVFDIAINGSYMNWDEVVCACQHNDIETVPELYRGPFSHEIIEQNTDGNSVLSTTKQIREGVVFKPLQETTDPDLPGRGRKILKSVSAIYLSKDNTDNA